MNKSVLVAATTFLAMAASSSAWAQQFARPDSTGANGGWTAVNAATHHEAVDEIAQDNNDYIDSGANNSSTITLGLSQVSDPGTYANNHILRFACQSTGGSKGGERCDIALYSGAALVASTSNNTANRDAYTVVTLTVPDATGIDYQNLSVELTSSVGSGESIQISWVELEVPAASTSAPSVTTIAATGVTQNQATLGGNVSNDGGDPLSGVGVYYNTTSGFTPPGQGIQLPMTIQPVPGDFTGDLTSLPAGTTYYYRAYAANSIGTTYATNELSFTTKDFPVMLATPTVTVDSPTSATLGGTMTSNGFDPTGVSDCGIEWGTSSGGPYTQVSAGVCTENNAFFAPQLVGLTTGQDHFFRSYATNSVGTGYSNEGSFKPVDAPTVTGTLGTVTDTTAVLGGDITATGGDTITAVGIIWDTDNNPVDGGLDVPMAVADPFSQEVTGLPAGTPLWFVAYATNGAGPGYSTPVPFTTLAGAPTMDPTPTVTDVVVDGATLGGTLTSDGGGTISDCGVEWSSTPGGPYGPGQSAGICAEGVGFSTPVSGLTTGVTYYFRAYATNEQGTDYSGELSFVPQGLPVVVSAVQANVSFNAADLGGDVTNDGGAAVTQRGIVWDTNPDPETQPTRTTIAMGSGTGPFSQTVSLPPASTIYFEAYATSAAGTAYSDDNRSFPTGTEPTAQATNAQFTNIAGTSVRITWTRGNGEGVIVVLRETATALADPQDAVDYAYALDYTQATEIPANSQNFVVYKGAASSAWVTGLTLSTAYSVAVYEYAGSGASTDYLQTLPAVASDITKDYASHNHDNRIDCTQCHGGHFSLIPRGEDQKAKCVTCHQPGQAAAAKLMFNNHLAPNRNPAIDNVDCGMCHELHNITGTLTGNTTLSTNTITPGTAYNKSFLRANVGKYVDPNYSADKEAWPKAFLHNDQPKREEGNANLDPAQPAVTPERAVEGGDAATSRGYCQVCHTQTGYHRNNPSAGASTPADHGKTGLMQCHDGSTENTACAVEVDCGDCHEHSNSFVGVNNNLPCQQCHDQPQSGRPIITTQFDTANVLSSHIPNGTPTQPDCLVCHGQPGHAGTVFGIDADDGVTSWGTANPNTLATGAGEVFEPHCMSCHDDGLASSLPASGSDQTQASPFINAAAPPIIDPAAWSAAGHNRPSATFPASPMTCVGDGANGCHGSGHGSQQLALLADAAGPATSMMDFCINCHDGDPASDVTADFTGVLHQETSASKALINNRHDVTASDQAYSGASLACSDCHNPHADELGKSVSDLITGGPLRDYSPNNTYVATGATNYNFSYNGGGNLDPINPEGSAGGFTEPDHIQYCLVCHDGTPPPGVVMDGNMENIADAWAGGDVHGAGNAAGAGGSTNKGALKVPYVTAAADGANEDPSTRYAAMNCTTCHGAHGSGNIFNLRTSITVAGVVMEVGGAGNMPVPARITDPTVYDLPPIDGRNVNTSTGVQTDHYWGVWCSFCHKMDTHPGKVESDSCTGGHMHNGGAF